jgi:hypothetical protein
MSDQNGLTRTKAAADEAPVTDAPDTTQLAEVMAAAQNLKQEAEFWQQKYFEQLQHSTQVIAALNRPMLNAAQQHA